MYVSVENEQSDLTITIQEVKNLVECVILSEGYTCDEVAIHFVSKEKISSLHADFFDDPTPTDCITFPIDDQDAVGYRYLGEVFVCPSVALEYAKENQLEPYDELTLYVVHGLLHLMGYDDLEENALLQMREAENKHMKLLSQKKKILKKP